MNVQVVPVTTPADESLIRNLYPLYLHDLSEFTDVSWIDEQGRWMPPIDLDIWFESGFLHALIVLADGKPAGFALVARPPFIDSVRDFRLHAFFILRAYRGRRRGVARRAATVLFDRFRGRWEVPQSPGSQRAIAFWRQVIAQYTGGRFVEETIGGMPTQLFSNADVAQTT